MKNAVTTKIAKLYAFVLIGVAILLSIGRLAISHNVDLLRSSDLLYFLQLGIMLFAGLSLYYHCGNGVMKYDSVTFLLLVAVQLVLLLFAYGGLSEINDLPIFYPLIFLVIFTVNLWLVYWHFRAYKKNLK